METEPGGWWRQHAWTIAILLTAFGLAIVVRSIFAYSIFQQWGWLYVYGGGSDSFYHSRVMAYIIGTHSNLVYDHGLNYPHGAINPREPLFDWMNAVLGILFQGFFHASATQPAAVVAGAFFLDIQSPLWAAMGVFPVYLIGKEVSSRRMGLIAALIYPFMVASIESSGLGYANYLTFYAFVMLLTVYAYVRMIKAVGHRRWVTSYRHPRDVLAGLRAFLRYERTGVKWSVFTGVCLGALALSWQGYPFFIAALVGFLVVQMIVERIRRVDSFALYVGTWIVGLVGFPMAMPYYLVQGLFAGWFDTPLLVFFGALLILLPFLFLRDSPWVVSIPALLLTGAVAVGGLAFIDRNTFVTIVTGQGYFVKNLVYSTVAEAQAPSIDSLILGFGVLTFFLAFAGLALVAIKIARHRFHREHVMFLVFGVISIYLPITAAKFFLLGSAVFALLPAEVLLVVLNVAAYGQLRRNVASLSDTRSQFTAFRRSFKARHVLVMGFVLLILIPNVWYAIDAGVPYNIKSGYNTQIFDTLPPPLRTSAANASSFYLGAAGTSLDTPNQYDENGYDWLATQDTNVPLAQRPAFVSWWDYGFQALSEGLHPTVADNFQNGIDPAGAFLLSQNESEAIGILTVELLATEQKLSGQPYLSPGLNSLLAQDGVNVAELHTLMVNTSATIALVLAHPERYLPVDAAHLDGPNAMYMATSWYLATALPLSGVAQLYNDVQAYTGWSVRYAMVDSRLFPFSGQQTGIFYAPADLTDRVIGPGGTPSAFFNVTILGTDGRTYSSGALPANVQAVSYNINYFPAFYNSMIYHIFVGYNGTEVGQGNGIPGLSGNLTGASVMPGWMMQHFQVVYRTAYYCPYANPNAHPGCFVAENLPTAESLAKKHNGTADPSTGSYYNGGETMLEYYAGQPFYGNVVLPDGAPVPGARVTVYDSWNIPHQSEVTGKDGSFSLVLPPGNDTVNVTAGPLNGIAQAGTTRLASVALPVNPALALRGGAPALVRNIVLKPATVTGFLYWNNANNSSFSATQDSVLPGAVVNVWGTGLTPQHATTDASGSFTLSNVPPGVYQFAVVYRGANYTQSTLYLDSGQTSNQTIGLTPGKLSGTVLLPTGNGASGAAVTVTGALGVIARTTAAPSGAYSVGNMVPGNYSVSAELANESLHSAGAAFSIATSGSKVKENLTLEPTVSVSLTVVANGNPVGGFPVRFTPLSGGPPPPRNATNSTAPPGPAATPATANSTAYLTPANGTIYATLPVGNYSIYGVGLLGGSTYAGLASAYLTGASSGVALAPLFLSPASEVRGFTPPPSGGLAATSISVTAYTPRGDAVSAAVNLSAAWAFWLPAGTYAVLAELPGGTNGPSYAAMTTVALPEDAGSVMSLPLVPSVALHATFGAPIGSGTLYPARGALVSVSLAPGGAPVSTVSNSVGNASLEVPSSIPFGSSYCLNVSALGFYPFSTCGLTPTGLESLTSVPMRLRPVPTNLTITGFPSGATIHVNLTASSPPASSVVLSGGSNFSVDLLPGGYSITAWAQAPKGDGVYRAPVAIPVTLPFGYHAENISIALSHQVATKGRLLLPPGSQESAVSVRLIGPSYSENLTGTGFTTSFLATPGPYTVLTELTTANVTYANLTRVVVNATGVLSPAVELALAGGILHGNLTRPDGSALPGTTAVTLYVPSAGANLSAIASGGSFSLVLPRGLEVVPSVNVTLPVPGANGVVYYTTYTVVPGVSCTVRANLTDCPVALRAAVEEVPVSGRVSFGNYPGPLDGTATFFGPLPGTNVTTTPISGSTFSVALAPGVYDVYATTGSGPATLAAVEHVYVSFGNATDLAFALSTTWTDTLTVLAGTGGAATGASVSFHGPAGAAFTLPNAPLGSPLAVALPPGLWTVTANSTARPYGVPTPTTASAAVALLTGNAATVLTLQPTYHRTALFALHGPSVGTVPASGGVVSFSYALSNTGNVPLAVHLVGTPSTWQFNFTPENLSLGVLGANASASGEVVVHVPSGTTTDHAPIALEALLPDGTAVGVVSPAPTVTVLPHYALGVGPTPSVGTAAPNQATVGFYVANTGNTPEVVALGVVDLARLAQLGWGAVIQSGTSPVGAQVTLPPASNNSYTVSLQAPKGTPVSPGSVTVVATIVNLSSSVSTTVTLPVNPLAVSITNGTIAITGPSIGSPPAYPDWVVPLLSFLPALAVVGAAVTYRWWRTRRWVRR